MTAVTAFVISISGGVHPAVPSASTPTIALSPEASKAGTITAVTVEPIVFTINDFMAGGKEISIIFRDKPDKLFNVWVYKLATGNYDLREFWQNPGYSEDKMKEVLVQYKQLLDDKAHST